MFGQERGKEKLGVCLRIEATSFRDIKTKLAQVQEVYHIAVQVDNCILAGRMSG